MRPILQPTRLIPILGLLVLACSSTEERTPYSHIADLVDRGEYDQAVEEAAQMVEEEPDDDRARDAHRMATVAWYLEAGRRHSLEHRHDEALEEFVHAYELAPDDEIVRSWVSKTTRSLADYWIDIGSERRVRGDLEGSLAAFAQAVEYQPGDTVALAAVARAVLLMNYRAGLSTDYYTDGLRALSDYWLEQAQSRFTYSQKYDPDNDRNERRLHEVRILLAEERTVVARQLEADGLWGAARNEYRLALALDAENEQAIEGVERAGIEARAARLLSEARMTILRGDYQRARALIDEGLALTEHQKELFDGAIAGIQETRLGGQYEDAIHLEKDYLYEEAIVAYGEILAEAQFYRDVLTRKSTLEEYVRRADELYQRASAADDADKLSLLQQISIFWPEYEDVPEQIARLSD